jgi:uncharacterized membrane protein
MLGVAAVALVYAVLAHISNADPRAHALGVVLAVAPLAIALCVFLWRTGQRAATLFAAVACVVAVARWWPLFAAHFPWLYLFQQAGTYALLGLVFGRSLRAGREPLCSYWASLVHGPLSQQMQRYTRQVTFAWTLFFALVTVALVAMFLLAPLTAWSAFANFCVLPLVAAMFVGEYLVRGRAVPEAPHASLLDGVRAFLASSAGPQAMRRG